jgi:phosphate transport system substrate-binding protein
MKLFVLMVTFLSTFSIYGLGDLKGKVKINGSSTVFLLSEAIAEKFKEVQPKVRVTVGVTGTGGGFAKFLRNETDINDASRKIEPTEAKLAKDNKINYVEIPVAYDGISIVVHKSNDWVDKLTVDELKLIWKNDSKVQLWSDIRKEWPKKKIMLYGPGKDSGTFDYFNEAILGKHNGKKLFPRSDFSHSEDDNMIIKGVAGEKYSMGFFGYAYYKENKNLLKVVPIQNKNSKVAITPSESTINDGSYAPLSRSIYIYVNEKSLNEKPWVKSFVEFYVDKAASVAKQVGYVPLKKNEYENSKKLLSISK